MSGFLLGSWKLEGGEERELTAEVENVLLRFEAILVQ